MSEIKRNLMLWAVGYDRSVSAEPRGRTCARSVMLESSGHLSLLEKAGVIGPGSTVFAPDDASQLTSQATVVRYQGSTRGGGEDFVLGSHFVLQTLKYSIGEYVSMVGPAIARIDDGEDLELLMEDADYARSAGQFPEFLTHPLAQLADTCSLGGSSSVSGPEHRLHVDDAGMIRTSMSGAVLGEVGDSLAELGEEYTIRNTSTGEPCAVALAERISETDRLDALQARPWLGTYFDALHALRHARARGFENTRVSGFGESLTPNGPAIEQTPGEPGAVLVWSDDQVLICDRHTDRVISVGVPLGELADLLLRSGSVDRAAEWAPVDQLRKVEAGLARYGIVCTGSVS